MGWGSATGLFDGTVDVALSFIDRTVSDSYTSPYRHSDEVVTEVVKKMYTEVDWGDWDTQDESKYFYPYLMNVMYALDEIDQETYLEHFYSYVEGK